jgi:nitroreductase/dihydropteridine reductase
MEFRDVVMERYATKTFTGEKVPEQKIDELIDLIRFAPSALNLQPWRIKVVSDQKTRDALAPALFGQPQAVNCSHLIILCANTDVDDVLAKADKSMKEAGFPDERRVQMIAMATNLKPNLTLYWAQQQVYLALGNAVNGAKALGLDSCPMTGFDPKQCSAILGLPPHLVPTAVCPIGYGADTPGPKARLSRADILL